MKYIRTNEGIFTIEQYNHNPKMFECLWGETLKQADTIEELCDTYVFVGKDKDENGNPILWDIKQDIPFLMEYYFKNNVIYGAIWTSKGLIYVAKMNKEGALELI